MLALPAVFLPVRGSSSESERSVESESPPRRLGIPRTGARSAGIRLGGPMGESSSSESAKRLRKPPLDAGASSSSSLSTNRDLKPDLPLGAGAGEGFDLPNPDMLNPEEPFESRDALLFFPRMVGVSSAGAPRIELRRFSRSLRPRNEPLGERERRLSRPVPGRDGGDVARSRVTGGGGGGISIELPRIERFIVYLPIESTVETEPRRFFLKLDSESESYAGGGATAGLAGFWVDCD